MLIHDASKTLQEPAVAGARFSTASNNNGWADGLAEVGIVILLLIWLVHLVTKPFRRPKSVPINPFAPYDGMVYMAVTDTRIAFFETKDNWFSTELGPMLTEYERSDFRSISRTGVNATLRFRSQAAFELFWMDSQFAWQNVTAKLNESGDVASASNAE